MGKLSRDKGASFERCISTMLRRFYPKARRGIQYRDGGKEVSDVINTPYHVECRHGKTSNIDKKIEQAQRDCGGAPILVITKRNKGPILVTMLLEDWILQHAKPGAENQGTIKP